MKKYLLLILLAMLLVPQTGWAASFTIDDLKYESISYDEVKIIESPTARGDIVIPKNYLMVSKVCGTRFITPLN